VTVGTLEEIARDIDALGDARLPSYTVYVPIGDLLAEVRARARDAGVDLSASFFPPFDHPDQASLARILAGIAEMSALRECMADALTPRQTFDAAQRTERVWLQ
jgi:sugar phosphate isomerase/epimerase